MGTQDRHLFTYEWDPTCTFRPPGFLTIVQKAEFEKVVVVTNCQ